MYQESHTQAEIFTHKDFCFFNFKLTQLNISLRNYFKNHLYLQSQNLKIIISLTVNKFMKLKIILYVSVIFILYSCQKNNDTQLSKEILGEWTYIKTEDQRKPRKNNDIKIPPPQPPFGRHIQGYIFSENNICENKSGYFKRIEAKEREDRKTFFLGTETKYKIQNDSLKILDLVSNTWENQKINSIVGDTLITKVDDSIIAKYARTKYKINPNENYDKIIVSSSGCYGSDRKSVV